MKRLKMAMPILHAKKTGVQIKPSLRTKIRRVMIPRWQPFFSEFIFSQRNLLSNAELELWTRAKHRKAKAAEKLADALCAALAQGKLVPEYTDAVFDAVEAYQAERNRTDEVLKNLK